MVGQALKQERLPHLQNVQIIIEWLHGLPERGLWIKSSIFRALFEDSMLVERSPEMHDGWKEMWDSNRNLKNFNIIMRTYNTNLAGTVGYVESLTPIWTEGYEERVARQLELPPDLTDRKSLVRDVAAASKRVRTGGWRFICR